VTGDGEMVDGKREVRISNWRSGMVSKHAPHETTVYRNRRLKKLVLREKWWCGLWEESKKGDERCLVLSGPTKIGQPQINQ
jgi:hypothetical protein